MKQRQSTRKNRTSKSRTSRTRTSSTRTSTSRTSKRLHDKGRGHITTSYSNKNKSHLVRVFMEMLNMIKLYHWKTHSFAQHKATDELYSKIQDNVDRFIEILMGKDDSRIHMLENKIDLVDVNSKPEFKQRMLKYRKFLTDMNMYFDDSRDSDLLNVRDELLADVNQFLYLLTLN